MIAQLFIQIVSHAIPPTENALSALLDLESFLLEIALFAHFFIRIVLNVPLKLEAVPFAFMI